MPSIVSLTVSRALKRLGSDPLRGSDPSGSDPSSSGCASCGHRRNRRMRVHRDRREDLVERRRGAERTAGLVDVLLELAAELVDVARDRDRGRLAERAEALAVDAVADVEQQIELVLLGVAGFEPAQDLRHPARSLAARRALAAGLVLVELRDPD